MKIFFTTPFDGKEKYQEYIDEIIRVVEDFGATVVSTEKDDQYKKALSHKKLEEFGNRNRAHYEFIRRGIASSDAVIFEASYENFRVGHEATLASMYRKPVLVLSQIKDYSEYIIHEKFFGKKYKNNNDLGTAVKEFLKSLGKQIN